MQLFSIHCCSGHSQLRTCGALHALHGPARCGEHLRLEAVPTGGVQPLQCCQVGLLQLSLQIVNKWVRWLNNMQ